MKKKLVFGIPIALLLIPVSAGAAALWPAQGPSQAASEAASPSAPRTAGSATSTVRHRQTSSLSAREKARFEALKSKAEAAINAGRNDAALQTLHAALAINPRWDDGWWQAGSILYDRNDFRDARDAFANITEIRPTNGGAWVMMGLCDFELHDFGMSFQHIQRGRALGFPPDAQLSDVALYHQIMDLILFTDYEQAGVLLERFMRAKHRSDGLVMAAGLAALRLPILAEDVGNVFTADEAGLIRAVGDAEFLAAGHDIPGARKEFDDLLQRHPDFPNLHYAYGTMLLHYGEDDDARRQLLAELQVTPSSVPTRLQLAGLDLSSSNASDGLPYADDAVRLAPDSFAAHYLRGSLLIKAGKLDDGAKELEASEALEPSSAEVRYALAQAYLHMHRRADALREEQAFKRLKPIEDSIVLHGNLPASLYEPPAPGTPSAEKR
jgi:tetratricopeptide (TPR) repeat protein